MPGQVKLPGIGPVDQKWLYAGGALVAGIVGWAYLHRPTPAPTDPGAGSGDFGSGEGVDDGSGWTSAPPPGGSTVTGGDPVDPEHLPPTTNAEWTRRVIDYLAGSLGWDAGTVAAALGKYLARQPIAPGTESDTIAAALAAWGKPPQGEYSVILQPPPVVTTPPPATGYHMTWAPIVVKGSYVGMTLAGIQDVYGRQAQALHVITYTPAVAASYVSQAAVRNGMSPRSKPRSGSTVYIRKASK